MLAFLFTKTPLSFLLQSLWRDEAFTYLLAKKNLWQIIVLTVKDYNPPFYYFFIHFWIKIFGGSEVALRLPSFIFFLGTIYLSHHIILDILKIEGKKSWLYLLFFLLNPLLVYYAFEARMYSMLAFFATASFYFFYKKNKIPYLTVTILGLYTHYFMILAIAVQLIFLIINKNYQAKKYSGLKMIIYSLIAFFPWILFYIFNKKNEYAFWISPMSLKEIINLPVLILSGYEKGFWFLTASNSYLLFLIIFNWLIIGLISFGLIKTNWKNNSQKKTAVYFILWGLLPPLVVFLVSFYLPLFVPRYLIFSSVGLSFLLIYCLEKIKKTPRIIFFLVILTFLITYQNLQVKYRQKINFSKTINNINSISRPSDVIYVISELDFHIAEYYSDENRVYLYDKTYDQIPNFVGKILISKNKIATNIPNYPARAFILKSDNTYDILSIH